MKIKWGALVVDGRGKLGGHVASKNKSGSFLRTKVTPTNPNTPAQALARNRLAQFSANWSALTEAERASFNAGVVEWSKTNIFGDIKNPTGKNLYSRLNINLAIAGYPAITVLPAKIDLPQIIITDIQANFAGDSMAVIFTGNATGAKVVLSATPILSAGTSSYAGKFRIVDVRTGANTGIIEFANEYIAKFGDFTNQDNIAVSVQLIGDNGQKSVPVVVKVTPAP